MLHLTLWGPLTQEENQGLSDLSWREIAALVPLCIFMLWIGVAPQAFLKPSEEALAGVLEEYQMRIEQPPPEAPFLRPDRQAAAGSKAHPASLGLGEVAP
jgi:NADH:ubiquinone oxidoreductase subunit 4 (subunit M)